MFDSAAPLLRAEQFIPGNKDHLLILKAMGITVTKTDDGKVQLTQDVSSVSTASYTMSIFSSFTCICSCIHGKKLPFFPSPYRVRSR